MRAKRDKMDDQIRITLKKESHKMKKKVEMAVFERSHCHYYDGLKRDLPSYRWQQILTLVLYL